MYLKKKKKLDTVAGWQKHEKNNNIEVKFNYINWLLCAFSNVYVEGFQILVRSFYRDDVNFPIYSVCFILHIIHLMDIRSSSLVECGNKNERKAHTCRYVCAQRR